MAPKTKNSTSTKTLLREGYKGKDLPAGTKPVPPKGPAAGVPVKKSNSSK